MKRGDCCQKKGEGSSLPKEKEPSLPTGAKNLAAASPTYLNILHLSDFHFKLGDPVDQFERYAVISSILKQIIDLVKKKGKRFDLIIITGDLAFSGKAAEYQLAEAFCKKLLRLLPPSSTSFSYPRESIKYL